MNGIYEVILRFHSEMEKKTLVYWPTEEVKQDFLRKAKAKGIEVKVLNENVNNNANNYE